MKKPKSRSLRKSGLTLIELLLAISILAVMSVVSYLCFDIVVRTWQTGTEIAATAGQGEYVIEQLAAGLRSAYYPDTGKSDYAYGFTLSDGGDSETSTDTIGWTKTGAALVGEDASFVDIPHRVSVRIQQYGQKGNDGDGLSVQAYRQALQLDDFNPETDIEFALIAPRAIGFNCRVLDKDQPVKDDLPNWVDEWKWSNSLPSKVELTLYLNPDKEGEEPLEIKRIVSIPMADFSQNPEQQDTSQSSKDQQQQQGVRRQQQGQGGVRRIQPGGGL